MNSELVWLALRRVWWATLPYYGWVPNDGLGVPPPRYAYPLAWLNRLVNRALGSRDTFGPRYRSTHPLVGAPRYEPWQ